MSSKTKQVGIIGEEVLALEFLKNGYIVSKPIGDNAPYDLIVDKDGELRRIQVKTTEKVMDDGTMEFHTNITNPFKKTYRKYTKEEVDYFGLYCLENNYVGLLPFSDYTTKVTKIRIIPPKNNQKQKVKMANDYCFSEQIKKFI